MSKIRIFLTDIDGVWTDGGMYYDNQGSEFKKFNTSDSAGVLLCNLVGIKVGIISGEDSFSTIQRAKKLNIEHCFVGVSDKVKIATKLLNKLNINWEEVAYIGDDLNDIKLFEKVGLSACPSNAPDYIKSRVNWNINVNGGDGAFRGFVEKFLNENNLLSVAIDKYLDS